MSVVFEKLTGEALQKAIPALAKLRIEVFRDFPYLYDGSFDYEERYLDKFSKAKDSILVTARTNEHYIGCATGSALSAHHEEFAAPFLDNGLNPQEIFYFGESVLLKTYRGQGLGHIFFDEREAHAKQCGYQTATFCAVLRPSSHPLKPMNYNDLQGFWKKRGYSQVKGLIASFRWKDVDQAQETDHAMQFWVKDLQL